MKFATHVEHRRARILLFTLPLQFIAVTGEAAGCLSLAGPNSEAHDCSPASAPQELVLRSSGKKIAPGFIRPYAICETPPFVNSKDRV